MPNSRRRARTRGSSLKGGLVTTHSPRSCVKKSTSSWMTSNPSSARWCARRAVAVEGFPQGEVARDVGAHVLPRGEGGHVVVVFYHTYYNRKFRTVIVRSTWERGRRRPVQGSRYTLCLRVQQQIQSRRENHEESRESWGMVVIIKHQVLWWWRCRRRWQCRVCGWRDGSFGLHL